MRTGEGLSLWMAHAGPKAAALVVCSLLATPPVAAGALRVVATSPTFASLVEAVGGEEVKVHTVVAPCDDIHFIEPRPSDIARLARADAFVHAGLDLELWRGPLVEASSNRKLFQGGAGDIDLSQGIQLLEVPERRAISRAEGDIHVFGNPHYWVDPDNVPIMTETIVQKLSGLASDRATVFRANREAFLQRLARADAQWKKKLAPYAGHAFVPYHRDWPYLSRHFGLERELWLEPKPNVPPSARHLKEVITALRAQEAPRVIVREPFHPRKTARTVARETEAVVVTLCQHSGCLNGTDDYLSLMEANVNALSAAFEGREEP